MLISFEQMAHGGKMAGTIGVQVLNLSEQGQEGRNNVGELLCSRGKLERWAAVCWFILYKDQAVH